MDLNIGTLISFLIGLALLYILGLILVIPLKIIGKLMINGLVGGITLFIFNFIGGIFGLTIAINPLNALIAGFLGVPGVLLLIIAQYIL